MTLQTEYNSAKQLRRDVLKELNLKLSIYDAQLILDVIKRPSCVTTYDAYDALEDLFEDRAWKLDLQEVSGCAFGTCSAIILVIKPMDDDFKDGDWTWVEIAE